MNIYMFLGNFNSNNNNNVLDFLIKMYAIESQEKVLIMIIVNSQVLFYCYKMIMWQNFWKRFRSTNKHWPIRAVARRTRIVFLFKNYKYKCFSKFIYKKIYMYCFFRKIKFCVNFGTEYHG